MMRFLQLLLIVTLCLSTPAIIASDSLSPYTSDTVSSPDTTQATTKPNTIPEKLVVGKDTILTFYGDFGPYSPQIRVNQAKQRIERLEENVDWNPNHLKIVHFATHSNITYGYETILEVTDAEAQALEISRKECATLFRDAIVSHLKSTKTNSSHLANLGAKLGLLILSLLLLVVAFRLLNLGYKKLLTRLEKREMYSFKIGSIEVINSDRQRELISFLLRGLRVVLFVIILYLALPVIFSIFPMTRGLATTLFSYVSKPLGVIIQGIINFIPNLITIAIVLFITRFVLRLLHFLAIEIERGEVKFPGFYADWARPTFNMLRFVIYAFVFVLLFPYLPGSQSPVFQGVALLIAIVIAIGSIAAISNVMAGLLLTYVRPFKKGRYVKIGNVAGRVMGRTLMNTRIKTFDEEDVTIPNVDVLKKPTISYSSTNKHTGGKRIVVKFTCYEALAFDKLEFMFNAVVCDIDGVSTHPSPTIVCTEASSDDTTYQITFFTKEFDQTASVRSSFVLQFSEALRKEHVKFALK